MLTVGDLRMHLKIFDDDDEVIFGGGNLTFYRTKKRGPNLVQIEFAESDIVVKGKHGDEIVFQKFD